MWDVWHFSPELEERLHKFIASATTDGPPPGQLLFRDKPQKQSEVDVPVCEDVPASTQPEDQVEVVEEKLQESIAECSILLSRECTVDILRERPLSSEELTGVGADQLSGLTDTAALHLCQSVCEASVSEQNRLCAPLCRDVLLPRLLDRNLPCERPVLAALRQTADSFPQEWCTHLLVPVLSSSSGNHSVLESVLQGFSLNNKQIALRCCLESGLTRLQEWQVPLFQVMATRLDDERATGQLVSLLNSSAQDLATSVKFGKLLVVVIQQLGSTLSPTLREQLSSVIAQHKSLMKGVASKTLKALS
ncbi:uncharacterized protein [Anabrus simplex]|uniref:uncharacterized protein n=1 Tax=Anabrus simplex TaxID=316456 RepID=UPI0035A3C0EE